MNEPPEFLLLKLLGICFKSLKFKEEESLLTIFEILEKSQQTTEITQELLARLADAGYPIKKQSERTKELIISCLIKTLEKSKLDLDDRGLLPILAHNITMILDYLMLPGSLQFRLENLKLLEMVIDRVNNPDSIAQFLPGLLSGLVKFLKKNATGNHKLLVAAVNVITLALEKSLSDKISEDFLDSNTESGKEVVKSQQHEHRWLKRDLTWHTQTTTNIALVLPMVYSFKSHPNVNVRKSVFKSCINLLDTCCKSLKNCHPVLIETLLYFISDQDKSLASLCKDKIWNTMSTKESSIWFQISLENSLSTLLASLDTLVKQADDKKKIESLLMIHNHLIVMKSTAMPIVENQIDQVVSSFIWLLDPQVNNVKLVQETSLSAFDTIGKKLGLGFPKHQFSRFNDQTILTLVAGITRSILELDFCKQSLLDGLFGHLDVKEDQYQTMILLNQVFDTKDSEVAETIVGKYLEFDFSVLDDTQISSFTKKVPTIAESNAVIVKTSVMLEGLSMALTSLSPVQVAHVMMDGLYLMLEKLGDPNYTVSSSAASCLEMFATYCEDEKYSSEVISNALVPLGNTQHSSVANLVLKHVDYLLDSCSKKLRYVTRFPMAPRVLVAAIKVTGISIIGPLMTDCVDQVLDILDEFGTSGYVPIGMASNDVVDDLFEVLHSLVNLMDIGSPIGKFVTDSDSAENNLNCSKPMAEFIKREKVLNSEMESNSEKYENAKEFFTRKDIPESCGAPNLEEESEEPTKEQVVVLTEWETLSLKILQRSMYFLSSDSPRLRSKVLEIMYLGIPLLSHQPTSLYPLIHQIWPLILQRSLDKVHYVAYRALLVIKACATHGKEFMKQRIEKDVLSHLLLIFKQLQEPTKKPGSGAVSTTYKARKDVDLINTCLSTLESIIRWVPLSLSQKNELSIVLFKFLNARVYAGIIDQVLVLVRLLYVKHGDWVWVLVKMILEGDLSELGNVGEPRDYYQPCCKLVDLFSGTRCSLDHYSSMKEI